MNSPGALALVVTAFLLAAPATAVPASASPHAAAAAGPRPGCADSWRDPAGGAWSSGSNWSADQPPAAHQSACIVLPLRGPVLLNGTGTAGTLVLSRMDQLVLQGGRLTLASGPSDTAGTVLGNNGWITLGPGATLTNAGTVVATPGATLTLTGRIDNQPTGTIVADGALLLTGASLDNQGTIQVGPVSSYITASADSKLANNAGTIDNAGVITFNVGSTFAEGAGTTSGNPVLVQGGALDLEGSGASEFLTLQYLPHATTLSGNIAADQAIEVAGGPIRATSSFTNRGTIIGSGYLALPPGGTLTNEGTIEDGHGSLGTVGLTLAGNLTNTATGTIGEDGAGINMDRDDTTLANDGTMYMLFSNTYILGPGDLRNPTSRGATMRNAGTIYLGVGGDAAWGGDADASSFQGYPGDDIALGGTIVPVPSVEPVTGPGDRIIYGITGGHTIGNTSQWALTCGAHVTEGWSLDCGDTAELVEPKATTLAPTAVTVAGSGALAGLNAGWQTTYGHPVTLSATVSASNGSLPTGVVTFFGSEQNTANVGPAPSAIRSDLLGTAKLVAASNGQAKATLTTSALPPGRFMLLAMYGGDPTHLAASTVYGDPGGATHTVGIETITPQVTTVALSSSRTTATASTPVTLEATLTPGAAGPSRPTGLIVFLDNGVPIGAAPIKTINGATAAQLTTSLAVGASPITASYSGDYNFGGAASPALPIKIAA
jgi:adhesin HecA-like repeat protein